MIAIIESMNITIHLLSDILEFCPPVWQVYGLAPKQSPQGHMASEDGCIADGQVERDVEYEWDPIVNC
jgi:hypothetical protein